MQLEQLACIVEVAKTGSVTGAAQNLHISVSAVSQSISNLEAELGLALFHRSRTGTVPTAEGKAIIQKAFEVLAKINEIEEEAKSYTSELSGQLRLAAIPVPLSLFVDAIISFKRDYPRVELEITEKGTTEILNDLRHNKIDLGLIIWNEELHRHMSVAFERLLEGKLIAGVSRFSPLAQRSSLSPDMLRSQPLVLYNDDYLKWFIQDFESRYGALNVLFYTNNKDAIIKAVEEGSAITIGLDFSFYPPSSAKGIATIDLDIADNDPVYLGWVRSEEQPLPHASKIFIQKLKYQLDKIN
ncbi:LysR family transcriptional regulator [Paenibacillus pinisoli]|uniref:LysR family transcriptional regulator n=1 Tax=Paenibacillus pinisoli TaxID=1276110 RepID=A0A3A6Q2I1_9BACL|nr:LysR family transcriptional regulator [Paenibacillus pinisoli]RJX40184.1 LysR family transcriptional regulator [Paenibacillus pinisoli]